MKQENKNVVQCPNCHTEIDKKDLRICSGCEKIGCISCMTEDAKTGQTYCDQCW